MFPANPHKKALCVGISYKGQRGPYNVPAKDFELAGAHNDITKVCDLLTGYYDYKEQNITRLLDTDGYTQPTRDNILIAMKELMDEARPGEHLFFFFAGHGDQITNLDGTETDNKDEIILPLDWKLDESRRQEDRDRYSQIIIDDDMNDILVKRLPPGCRLTALFDSCHSGTILDLPYSRYFGPRSPERPVQLTTAVRTESPESKLPRPWPGGRQPRGTQVLCDSPEGGPSRPQSQPQSPVDIEHINQVVGKGPLDLSYTLARVAPRGRMGPLWRKGTWILRGDTEDEKLDHKAMLHAEEVQAVSWSACSDSQSGYEVKSAHENRSGGVMVEAFVRILKDQPYRTYGDILKCLGDRLKEACSKINKKKPEAQWIIQEPQLGSQQKPGLDKLFAP